MVCSDINAVCKHFSGLHLDRTSSSYNMENDPENSALTDTNPVQQQENQNAAVQQISTQQELLKLTNRTHYEIVQENGQRKYGPPPNWGNRTKPCRGCEVFIGKIPRDCFENELVPVFEAPGMIYLFRLMMDFSGANRGYGFCEYTNTDDAKRCVQMLDNYEIRKGKFLGVCLSVDNCRLFVGGIPKNKTKPEILSEMQRVTEGVKDVIVYPSAADKTKNRGFAFVEYTDHKAAAMARRKLIPGRIQLFGHSIAVDWAEPEREVSDDIMSKVKILYVRNLMMSTTEETLRAVFNDASGYDSVERVKKIRDYAFVHFKERDHALAAMHQLHNTDLEGVSIEVSLAKPVDKTENVRYTRGGGKNAQLLTTSPGLATTPTTPLPQGLPILTDIYGLQLSPWNLQNLAATRALLQSTMANRGGTNNLFRAQRTYRNAAGSRSAGTRTAAIPGYSIREKKHSVEESQFTCYNSTMGMDVYLPTLDTDELVNQTAPSQYQIQLQPPVLQYTTTHVELLEDTCQRNNWGTPQYQVQNHESIDPVSNTKVVYYIGKVTIPNLQKSYSTHPRAFSTAEEAKIAVSELALQLISFNLTQSTPDRAYYSLSSSAAATPLNCLPQNSNSTGSTPLMPAASPTIISGNTSLYGALSPNSSLGYPGQPPSVGHSMRGVSPAGSTMSAAPQCMSPVTLPASLYMGNAGPSTPPIQQHVGAVCWPDTATSLAAATATGLPLIPTTTAAAPATDLTTLMAYDPNTAATLLNLNMNLANFAMNPAAAALTSNEATLYSHY